MGSVEISGCGSGERVSDVGGDPACWAHVFERHDLATRTDVDLLVRTCYRAATTDVLLGPVLQAAPVDWPEQLAAATDFWMRRLFGADAGDGDGEHEPIERLIPFTDALSARWLDRFEEAVDEHFEGPVADRAKARAVELHSQHAGGTDGRMPR